MPKRIELTDALKAQITANVGDTIDFEKIAVFESTAVTSLPLNKRGTIFDKAQITGATFDEAAAFINNAGFVPIHTLHSQGYELPVGRVFLGESQVNPKGFNELRTLFYIDQTDPSLAEKIDLGIIEEVSVGISFQQLLCSACGSDLMASEDALWSQTCDNGHVMGMGDHFVRPNGLGSLRELSLVSKGASNGAKILGQQKRNLAADFGKPDFALAASLKSPDLMLFTPPTKDVLVSGEDPMLVAELEAKLATAATELELAKATAEVSFTAKCEAIAALEAERAAAVVALEAERAAAVVALDAALASAQAAAAIELAEAVQAATAAFEADQTKLEAAEAQRLAQRPFRIPLGGITNLNASHDDVDKKSQKPVGSNHSSAFKTPK